MDMFSGDNKKEYPAQPVFYSEENEGPWKDKSVDHTPVIQSYDRSTMTLRVMVPMRPSKSPRHYIEFIALLKGTKEIRIKRFDFSLSQATAEFQLPDGNPGDYRIVTKCNLHDMWDAPVKE